MQLSVFIIIIGILPRQSYQNSKGRFNGSQDYLGQKKWLATLSKELGVCMCVYGMNNQFISKANYGMQIKCPNFPLYEMLDQHRLGHCLNDFDNLIKLAS